jgi:hypothetical protein
VRAVRVDDLPEEDLGANRDDFGFHGAEFYAQSGVRRPRARFENRGSSGSG